MQHFVHYAELACRAAVENGMAPVAVFSQVRAQIEMSRELRPALEAYLCSQPSGYGTWESLLGLVERLLSQRRLKETESRAMAQLTATVAGRSADRPSGGAPVPDPLVPAAKGAPTLPIGAKGRGKDSPGSGPAHPPSRSQSAPRGQQTPTGGADPWAPFVPTSKSKGKGKGKDKGKGKGKDPPRGRPDSPVGKGDRKGKQQAPATLEVGLCRAWEARGECVHGEECRFRHGTSQREHTRVHRVRLARGPPRGAVPSAAAPSVPVVGAAGVQRRWGRTRADTELAEAASSVAAPIPIGAPPGTPSLVQDAGCAARGAGGVSIPPGGR